MASIREVAKLAHVAPSTVSRALNGSGYVSEKSKNKIKKAVEELDYIPNQWIRNLYKKRTGIIGVMTPDIIHPYFSTLWNYLDIMWLFVIPEEIRTRKENILIHWNVICSMD